MKLISKSMKSGSLWDQKYMKMLSKGLILWSNKVQSLSKIHVNFKLMVQLKDLRLPGDYITK